MTNRPQAGTLVSTTACCRSRTLPFSSLKVNRIFGCSLALGLISLAERLQVVLVMMQGHLCLLLNDQLKNVEEFPQWACVIARYGMLDFRRKRFRDRLVLNEKVFELLMEEAQEETAPRESQLRQLEPWLAELPPASRKLVTAAWTIMMPYLPNWETSIKTS